MFSQGVIQQLRGQEGGEGGQPKVHACPLLECPRRQNPIYFIKDFILLCTVMHGKQGIKLY